MKILLSPSKTFLKTDLANDISATRPDLFSAKAGELTTLLSSYSKKELTKTLGLSDKLVQLNYERYQNWSELESHPAGWYYRGETFFGLGAESLTKGQVQVANERLRIVSGLYGLLRITDEIRPYRLEMKTKFARGPKNLYEFWGADLATHLEHTELLLACASEEYMKSIRTHLSDNTTIITPKFLHTNLDGTLKNKMVFAKWSRGLLARWVIQNDIENEDDLQGFDVEGYKYSSEHSDPHNPVFIAPKSLTLKVRYKKT